MPTVNLHIDQNGFPNKFWIICAVIVGYVVIFFSRFRVRNLKTGVINNLNKKLTQLLKISIGLVEISKTFDTEKAKKEYKATEKLLLKYRWLMAKLEATNYLNNPVTQEICENLLSNFYQVEANVRMIAFADMQPSEEGKELSEFASRISLRSVQTQ